jgi:hypothetical protein
VSSSHWTTHSFDNIFKVPTMGISMLGAGTQHWVRKTGPVLLGLNSKTQHEFFRRHFIELSLNCSQKPSAHHWGRREDWGGGKGSGGQRRKWGGI